MLWSRSLLVRRVQVQKLTLKRLHTATPAALKAKIRYLVIDGYVKTSRNVLKAGGATTAGQLYANMLVKATAHSIEKSAA